MPCQDKFFPSTLTEDEDRSTEYRIEGKFRRSNFENREAFSKIFFETLSFMIMCSFMFHEFSKIFIRNHIN